MKLRVVINVVVIFGVLAAGALAAWYFISTREQAPAEERFRANIRVFLQRGLDARNAAFLITHMEIANPTGLLDEVQREMRRQEWRERADQQDE